MKKQKTSKRSNANIYNYNAHAIVKLVSNYFSVGMEDLKSRKRDRELVFPRQVIFYFLHKKTRFTLKAMAELFGLDHATALYGIKNITNLNEYDKEVKEYISDLDGLIDNRILGKPIRSKDDEKTIFLNLENITSFIYSDTKSITLSGYTKEEIDEIALKLGINTKETPPIEFKDTNLFIMREKEVVEDRVIPIEELEKDDFNFSLDGEIEEIKDAE